MCFVIQTPDGSFLDVTRNAYDLLRSCGVVMPEVNDPSFRFSRCGVDVSLIAIGLLYCSIVILCLFDVCRDVTKYVLLGKQMSGNHCYVDTGPPFIALLHPALGPVWDVTRQKVCACVLMH